MKNAHRSVDLARSDMPRPKKQIQRFPRFRPSDKPLVCYTEKKIKWLWRGRIPFGTLTILDGDPGVGKTYVVADITARITTGRPMPFSKRPTEPGNVILLSAEDDTRSVLRPRLRLAGADLNRVRVPPVYRESDGEMLYDIPSCVDKLERMVRRQKAVLIVIDPLMSFLPENVNPNSDPQIRKALFPLAKMAERTGVATLLLRHPNKKLNLPALYRGSGSLGGIAGVVRSGLIVVEYPLDPELCVLAVTKANYYRKRKSLVFRLEPVTNETARVKWQEIMDVNADDLCSSQKRPIGRAMVFLKRTVTKPKVSSVELTRLAKKKGIAPRTLARARKKLHIKAEKKGFGEKGEWSVGPPKTSRAR